MAPPTPGFRVLYGDCAALLPALPDGSIDVLVTSPPYWGQRLSAGIGTEADPRDYLDALARVFAACRPKLKRDGIAWINLGDAYNTPVNWRLEDLRYSTLGPGGDGLPEDNSAYTKPRARRRACLAEGAPWLRYGNLLGLPWRLALRLCDEGWLLRGEVVWRKANPMPEGRCRRPHRAHEGVYLFAHDERHAFRTSPPVRSVWEIPHERVAGERHFSRFPEALARRCVEALGRRGPEVLVLDPFLGSGTSGLAALALGCSFVGMEIDPRQVDAARARLAARAEALAQGGGG